MVELLAPAGDFISLRAVLNSGADSVYIGLKDNNMRANASNFTYDDIEKACKIASDYDSKIYLCTNILMKNKSIEKLESKLPFFKKAGVSALIISDIALIDMVVSNDMEAHVSVQENISNSYTLNTLSKLGASRGILSRELSLKEIKDINSHSPIETEIFIHGAMCMAISGRCFLSYGLYGRSANCGDCLQPCRKNWKLTYDESYDDNHSEVAYDDNHSKVTCDDKVINNSKLLQDEESFIVSKAYDKSYKTNFFSPKDLAMIEHIPEIIDTGVCAFKIEGRSRPADYGSTAVKVYKYAIDLYNKDPSTYKYDSKWMDELSEVFNRGFDTGFYFKQPYLRSDNNKSKYIKKDIAKVVNYYNKVKVAELKLWDDLAIGDMILIQGPTTGSVKVKVESMEINNKKIKLAKKGTNVAVAISEKLRENDFVYRLDRRKD